MNQEIVSGVESHKRIEEILQRMGSKKVLLVCDSSYNFLSLKRYVDGLSISCVKFSDFTPNPLYEDVVKGVKLFNCENCDAILAIGGGSAMDVAKCIKLFCRMNAEENYLLQEFHDSVIPLIAVPTTAGTGSESTRYAVIYYEGKKQSVTHESIIPDYAVLDYTVLKTLPAYQKKCTMLDALCQGIESCWSVNSTDESKGYSLFAIQKIMENYGDYIFNNSENAAQEIMLAANYAGRAINITQTTAAHAMSYKITSLYGLPHGHAVAICLPYVWEYMLNNVNKTTDSRGEEYLLKTFKTISNALQAESADAAINRFSELLNELEIHAPEKVVSGEIEILAGSVNPVRLKNNPVAIDSVAAAELYAKILKR